MAQLTGPRFKYWILFDTLVDYCCLSYGEHRDGPLLEDSSIQVLEQTYSDISYRLTWTPQKPPFVG